MWFSTSSGLIALQLTKEQARIGGHPGQCDSDVSYLSQLPTVARQLKKIDAALLRDELKEYGAWDSDELADHEQNLQRILWLACGDICESV